MIIILWAIGIFVVFGGSLIAFMIYWASVFKYRIRLFFKLSGDKQYHEGKTYRAREIFLSKGGVKRLWVPKLKEFVSYFGKKMGKNKYYYAEGPDGLLYNIVLGDLDTKHGMLDIEPVDRDLKDFFITNQKNINERYQKPKNWPIVMQSITIVLVIVLMFTGGYILFGQMKEAGVITNENLALSKEVAEANRETLIAVKNTLDEVSGTKSGINPVG